MPLNDLEESFSEQYQKDEEARNLRRKKLEEENQHYLSLLGETQPNQAQPQQTPQASPDGGYSAGQHISEIPRAAVSGVTHGIENTAEALDEVWDFAGKYWEDLHNMAPDVPLSKGHMWHPEAPVTGTGKIVEGATQFLIGMIPATKAVKAAGLTAKFGTTIANMAKGGIADYLAFDPTEKRLSDAIQSLDPDLKIPVISYLTTDEDDSAIESRLKNVGEGVLVGALGDAFFKSLKGIKGAIGKKVDTEVVEGSVPDGALDASGKPLDQAVADLNSRRLSEAMEQPKILLHPVTDEEANTMMNSLLNEGKWEGSAKAMVNMDHIENAADVHAAMSAVGQTVEATLARNNIPMKEGWDVAKNYFKESGIDIGHLRKLNDKTEDLAGYVTGARMVHADLMTQATKLAQNIGQNGGTLEDLVKFERSMIMLAEVQATVRGAQSSIARSLNAMKINVGPGMLDSGTLETMAHSRGGEKVLRDKAKRFLTLADSKSKANFLEKSWMAKSLDAVQYYWINSLLSSPTTWIVNAVSNAAVIGNSIAESGYAATKNALGGSGEITGGVLKDQIVGMWTGLMDAIRVTGHSARAAGEIATQGAVAARTAPLKPVGTMWTALRHETSAIDPTDNLGKFDGNIGESLNIDNSLLGKPFKLIKSVIGAPGRVLMATDELFKTVNYRGHLAMTASIEGRRAGKEGEALKELVKGYMENPPVGHHKEALKYAKYNTFQRDLGTAGKSVQRVVNEVPVLRFVMPFIRTPTNIIKYAGHHTPFINRVSSMMKEDIAAGGVRKELAEAKVATGSMMFATAGFLASQGLLAGGAHEDYRNGMNDLIDRQSYSVKIGDTWHSFSRLDPFGLFFGLTADMAELIQHSDEQEWGEVAGGLILAFSNNLASKTYLKGLVDFSDGILNSQGDSKKSERWLTNFTSSFIPNFMNQINRLEFDNEVKQINEFADNFKKRIWLKSEGVMAKRDLITGDKIHYKDALWGGYLQVNKQTEEHDPVKRELYNIRAKMKEIPKEAVLGTKKHLAATPLSGMERDRLHELSLKEAKIGGKDFQTYLADLFQSPAYKMAPTGDSDDSGSRTKRGMVRKAGLLYHNIGNQMLTKENPEIQARLMDALQAKHQEQLLAIKGQ